MKNLRMIADKILGIWLSEDKTGKIKVKRSGLEFWDTAIFANRQGPLYHKDRPWQKRA